MVRRLALGRMLVLVFRLVVGIHRKRFLVGLGKWISKRAIASALIAREAVGPADFQFGGSSYLSPTVHRKIRI
jgi:hypothetical protein